MEVSEYKKLLKESPLERDFFYSVKTYGIPTPVREHKFDRLRQWRFDFAWPNMKIAVELEGGVFSEDPGRHSCGSGFKRDCEKYNYAQLQGWRVYRFISAQDALVFLRDHVFNARIVPN